MARSTLKREKSPDLTPYLKQYKGLKHELYLFMQAVAGWFETHPDFNKGELPVIHSVKSRLKDEGHLKEKIRRKYCSLEGVNFAPDQLSKIVTDLSGVRVMHLHQKQFGIIHERLNAKVASGDWFLEETKAFTWDPESEKYFRSLGLETEVRPTFYTSVHYTIRPREDAIPVCEIQVRTLFEEIWGEVDHALNYPNETGISACREQLRVLSKLVGAGSRLVDSIFLAESQGKKKRGGNAQEG